MQAHQWWIQNCSRHYRQLSTTIFHTKKFRKKKLTTKDPQNQGHNTSLNVGLNHLQNCWSDRNRHPSKLQGLTTQSLSQNSIWRRLDTLLWQQTEKHWEWRKWQGSLWLKGQIDGTVLLIRWVSRCTSNRVGVCRLRSGIISNLTSHKSLGIIHLRPKYNALPSSKSMLKNSYIRESLPKKSYYPICTRLTTGVGGFPRWIIDLTGRPKKNYSLWKRFTEAALPLPSNSNEPC